MIPEKPARELIADRKRLPAKIMLKQNAAEA